jgi:hypothetical protein
MGRPCIFCSNPAEGKEDAWPVWLIKKLKLTGGGTMTAERGHAPAVSYRSGSRPLRIGVTCRDCNNGWMSDLEGRMARAIDLFLSPTRTVLEVAIQQDVAVWAVKTAMVLDAFRPTGELFFSPAERVSMMRHQLIGPMTAVWVAAVAGPAVLYSDGHDLRGLAGERHGVSATVSTMVFGPLALQVLRVHSPHTTVPLHLTPKSAEVTWTTVALQLWPMQDRVEWPPVHALNDEHGINVFSGRWLTDA